MNEYVELTLSLKLRLRFEAWGHYVLMGNGGVGERGRCVALKTSNAFMHGQRKRVLCVNRSSW